MSAREYPIQDVGLFVTHEIAMFVNVYADVQAEKKNDPDKPMPVEVRLALEEEGSIEALVRNRTELLEDYGYEDPELASDEMHGLGIEHIYCNCFTGDVESMESDVDNPIEDSFDDQLIAYVQTRRGPSVFNTGYDCIDEIVAEFRETFKDILPADFDYKSAICRIDGTAYS